MCDMWKIDFQTCPCQAPQAISIGPSHLLAVRISAGQKGCCKVESSFIFPTQSCTVQHSTHPYTWSWITYTSSLPCQPQEGYILESLDSGFSNACVVPTKVLTVLEQGVLRDNPKVPRMSSDNSSSHVSTLSTLVTDFSGKGQKLIIQWTTDLNMKYETIKLLQDNTGEDLDALSLAMTFLMQCQRHTLGMKNR